MQQKYLRWAFYLAGLLILLVASVVLSLSVGEMNLGFMDIFSILGKGHESMEYTILSQIRIPRVLLGVAVGGSLSLSGILLQGIYRNPLVEPYTLGISGGASLGVAFVIVFGLHQLVGSFVLPLAGFAGSFLIIFLVYTISTRSGRVNIQSMLLTGVMISFIASSSMMLLMATTSSENLHGIIFWIMGSLDEPDMSLIYITLIISVGALIVSYLFVQPLNALRLGEEKAKHLGINTDLSIKLLFLLASLLAGVSVAVAGVIGFVGLIIPHLMRLLVGSDYRILLISSFLSGSIFLVLSDVIARTIISPNELPIGVITGIVGGIAFLLMISRSSYRSLNKSR
ncbi:vitamin B12 ABC transporter, permease component BtuC [Aquipluma nitroreducens]|uniref:Vitamin B12 ABC transporter, permease component BtuC n=1 Tax=Aquipluma nitroreducens TaxID=2010828 RepID=A0A5K7SA14_9BACT|nr:iron ABC transporter permease [Aquipluma nitroreducens]BBE18306.1 vitamin B12 ABC transporter, permease component BtuC [Aquipluma nitroreducens]